jgi:hypothetical protein
VSVEVTAHGADTAPRLTHGADTARQEALPEQISELKARLAQLEHENARAAAAKQVGYGFASTVFPKRCGSMRLVAGGNVWRSCPKQPRSVLVARVRACTRSGHGQCRLQLQALVWFRV